MINKQTMKKEHCGQGKKKKKDNGLVRDSNPGPLAPKARIMPLDQQATSDSRMCKYGLYMCIHYSQGNDWLS